MAHYNNWFLYNPYIQILLKQGVKPPFNVAPPVGVKLGVRIGFKVLGVARQGVHPLGVKRDNLSQRHFPRPFYDVVVVDVGYGVARDSLSVSLTLHWV